MPPDFLNPTLDLFESIPHTVVLDPGAKLLCGFAVARGVELLAVIADIVSISPFRHMRTPGGRMSVAMTNCGAAAWVTDRTGYRYDSIDPETRDRWPAMPQSFADFAAQAAEAAGFPNFIPDACLVNRYEPGARLSLHQDKNERDFSQPIVSVSLGMPAIFLWGGHKRSDGQRRIPLFHGDVVVWGGPARMIYHGIHQLAEGSHPLTGPVRYNLTFRKAL
jgi:alkylated DNA repair protein (DNA oxidative demethylase)